MESSLRDRERASLWNKRHKDRRKWTVLKSRHNLSKQDYDNQLIRQDGVCSGCSKPPEENKNLHIDHDHRCCSDSQKTCGKCFRGLLCGNCNRILGLAHEDIETFIRLIDYLNGAHSKKFEAINRP